MPVFHKLKIILLFIVSIGLSALQPAFALSCASYLPWWNSSNHSSTYFESGAFDAQVKMLDEIVYFGEFQFKATGDTSSFGQIFYKDGANEVRIETATNHWYINQMKTTISRIGSANPRVRLTFTIGGAGNSDSFATIASNVAYRSQAAAEVSRIINEFGFNGVDLDWEGSTIPANGTPGADTAASNYGLLAAAIKGQLTVSQRLTAAIQYNRTVAIKAIIPYMNLVRIMTYDMPETDPAGDGTNGNHTSVEGVHNTMTAIIALEGVEANKLGVGSGFYGLSLTDPWNIPGESYADLDQTFFNCYGNYLPDNTTEWGDWGFDSVDSILAKKNHARKDGLQEIFSWEMSQDSFYNGHWLPLTTALTTSKPSTILLLIQSVLTSSEKNR